MDRYRRIKEKFKGRCRENVPAGEITTYRAGGPLDIVVSPENTDEAIELFTMIKDAGLDYFILGEGSNVLVSDDGFRGVIVLTGALNKIEMEGLNAKAQAGVLWDKLVEMACMAGLSGLEKTSFIPGTVGGAVRMNAGAFGSETFDRLVYFEALNISTLELETLEKKNLHYGYRFVEGIEKYLVLSAVFSFEKSQPSILMAHRQEIISRRKEKQPLEYPSAGSVFKRPAGDYASRLIDACGLKGLRCGGAMVSEKHAGFVINYDKASASDIWLLIKKIKKEVFEKTGVVLEEEQIFLGNFPKDA